nr:skin secretory protein xP2-like [Mirounga angustirostris]
MEKTLPLASSGPPTTLPRSGAQLTQWKRFRGDLSLRGGTSGLVLVAFFLQLWGVRGRYRSDGTVRAQKSLSPRQRGGSAARRRLPGFPAPGPGRGPPAWVSAPPTEFDDGGRAQGPGSGPQERRYGTSARSPGATPPHALCPPRAESSRLSPAPASAPAALGPEPAPARGPRPPPPPCPGRRGLGAGT